MRVAPILIRAYVVAVGALSLAALVYVYAFPPRSMLLTREGIPHFTPPWRTPRPARRSTSGP